MNQSKEQTEKVISVVAITTAEVVAEVVETEEITTGR
jgi:hypothetical protein